MILGGAPEGQRAAAQRSLEAAGIPVTHQAMVGCLACPECISTLPLHFYAYCCKRICIVITLCCWNIMFK